MKKYLVAYFSVSGVTRLAAEKIAAAADADLCEIRPETGYTAADLDWTNKKSRSTLEMQDRNSRPALAGDALDLTAYDVVFLGFPIWWGREPSVVDTFIETYNFSAKRVILFCTSGGGGLRDHTQLSALLPGAQTHKEITKNTSGADLTAWLGELSL